MTVQESLDFLQLLTLFEFTPSKSELTAGFKRDHEMENEILNEVLNNATYNEMQRPPILESENATFQVNTTVRLEHIEKETEDGIIRAHGVLIFSWEDSRIRWNATGKRAGLSLITKEYHRFDRRPYCPSIALIQAMLDIKRFRFDIALRNDGRVTARVRFTVFVPCDYDYQAFPLDKFRFRLSLVMLGETDKTVELKFEDLSFHGSIFHGYKEGAVYAVYGYLSNKVLPMFIDTGDNATSADMRPILFFVFNYERQADRFFYLMAFPILCLLFLSSSVAQLDSIHSLHLQIFCFSSILLHILYVKDELPPTVDGTPLIGYVYILVVFSSLSFFVLRAVLLYLREKKTKIEFLLPRINITLSVDSIIDWTLFSYAMMVFFLSAYLVLYKQAFDRTTKYYLF